MALISKEPVMVEVTPNVFSKVGYIWLELNCVAADKVYVNARLYKSKEDKESNNLFPMMNSYKNVGEIDSNIFDSEMGNKAHTLALTVFPGFTMEIAEAAVVVEEVVA